MKCWAAKGGDAASTSLLGSPSAASACFFHAREAHGDTQMHPWQEVMYSSAKVQVDGVSWTAAR